jgi:hypothetical protein
MFLLFLKFTEIGTVCMCEGGTSRRGVGEGRKLRWWYMVDELHIPIWNRTKKPLTIALSAVERRVRGETMGQYN